MRKGGDFYEVSASEGPDICVQDAVSARMQEDLLDALSGMSPSCRSPNSPYVPARKTPDREVVALERRLEL